VGRCGSTAARQEQVAMPWRQISGSVESWSRESWVVSQWSSGSVATLETWQVGKRQAASVESGKCGQVGKWASGEVVGKFPSEASEDFHKTR